MTDAPRGTVLEPLIRKLSSVCALDGEERAALVGLPAATRRLDPHTDIVRFGSRPENCCLLLDGWLYRYGSVADGGRQILSFYIAGDMPDLQSLHLHTMDHSLASLTACEIALVPHAAMRRLLRAHPGLSACLWRLTLIDASLHRERITGMGRRAAIARVAHFFCEMGLRHRAVGLGDGRRYALPATQGELADALGITDVHLNRVLRELRRRGLLTLANRELEILDWDGLVEVGDFDPTYLHIAPAPTLA